MKSFLFAIIVTMISLNTAYAQKIGDVSRTDDGYTKVYDTKNNVLASGYTGGSGFDWSFSNCILVIRKPDGYTKVYDEKLNVIASGYTGGEGFPTLNTAGCNFVIKKKDGYKKTYDKNLNVISTSF